MPFFGCHLSISGGYAAMGADALSIGADTFQYFTRNPRGGAVRDAPLSDTEALRALMREHHFGALVGHGPYTLNPCSADPKVRDFALLAMAGDLKRMDETLPGSLYNFHPGSHVGQGVETGIALIVETLDKILPDVRHTRVLLETMSGKGSEVGFTFEQLAEIIARVNCPEKMGVCMDTCHVYSAGYDIVSDLDGVLEHFDKVVGLNRLCAMHINDSMTPFDSHKDRHEQLGRGSLGEAAFARIAAHPALKNIPMCLETPQNTLAGWGAEIARLRAYAAGATVEDVASAVPAALPDEEKAATPARISRNTRRKKSEPGSSAPATPAKPKRAPAAKTAEPKAPTDPAKKPRSRKATEKSAPNDDAEAGKTPRARKAASKVKSVSAAPAEKKKPLRSRKTAMTEPDAPLEVKKSDD